MNKENARLTIAIQKSGRLFEDSWDLLNRCGIKVKRTTHQIICHSENFPIDILLVRDDDIPGLVKRGVSDFGIVGDNVLQEASIANQYDYSILKKFDFAKCRLSIAVPYDSPVTTLADLKELNIATTYPYLLRRYLQMNSLTSNVVLLKGSVEMAPRLGMAEAICDLVSSGETLRANNLREVITILNSQAVLISANKVFGEAKNSIQNSFLNRLEGVTTASETKCIMMHLPKNKLKDLKKILPGMESPTVMEITGNTEKIALNAVCRETIFWETMEKLKELGASSILVLPVEKIMI